MEYFTRTNSIVSLAFRTDSFIVQHYPEGKLGHFTPNERLDKYNVNDRQV